MRIWSLVLLAALVLAQVQLARADDGFLPIDDAPPWVLSNSDGDTSDQSDTERLDGEKECIDWDVIFGLECDNDFPPGEIPPGEEPGPEDPGPEDPGAPGPDVTVEFCEPDCEIIPTDDGGVIIWVDDPGGDTGTPPGGTGGTGGTGDTGSFESNMSEESETAYQVFSLIPAGTFFKVLNKNGDTTYSATFELVDKVAVATKPASYQVLLRRVHSSHPVPAWINFTITKKQTLVWRYLKPPAND